MDLGCQQIAVADESGEVKVFHFDNGQLIYLSRGHSFPITAAQISPDGKVIVSGDSQGGIMIWKVKFWK